MFKFNKPPCIYWNNKIKTEYLQRFILIHSIIYYILNDSIITDKEYDSVSRQLLQYAKKLNTEYKTTKYYYVFKEFDGSTGFDLYDNLNSKDKQILLEQANYLLRRGEKKNGN